MEAKNPVKKSKLGKRKSDEGTQKSSVGQAKQHKEQLERLHEKDPEFYDFLKEHDQELLQFDDEDIEEDSDTNLEDEETQEGDEIEEDEDASNHDVKKKEKETPKKVITSEMVDSWCNMIRETGKLSAIHSLMKAFRTACHYGDDKEDESKLDFSIMSSSVFNKVMVFVLNEMDGIIRNLLELPAFGGKKETIIDLMSTKRWKNYNHLVKSYLGNALHVLRQMTDTDMISFTLRRLKHSSIFLAAFPILLRKYVKTALDLWGLGGGALPIASLLFLRDLCIRLGSDCLDECFKGIYKAYVLNCQFMNAAKLQHVQFLGNCVIELYGVDLPTAYQHAFIFIRQLAMILREALSSKTKEAFRKVYEWKFMNCLELWTGAVCAYGSEADFRPVVYPLTQIIYGAARLVPTARYLPLRLRCIRMLNRIAASTGTFTPVSMLLLDMLEMKELNRPTTGGVGKAVDLRTILKVSKPTLKTRAFQEACVLSVVDELAEHLAQWSYSIAFPELSFIPGVRLRGFCKSTKVERFRRATRELIRQIEANSQFITERRKAISFLPNDPAVASFLEDEKRSEASPLSQYVLSLRQIAQQRNDSLVESSVLVGENSAVFGKRKIQESDEEDDTRDEEGTTVFSSSWLPGVDSKDKEPKDVKKKKKRKTEQEERVAIDEDIVEDLVLSSDEEDGPSSDALSDADEEEGKPEPLKPGSKKQKRFTNPSKKNVKSQAKKSRKRKGVK
ncbi:nucleolar complex-associated protein 2 [Rosa rugosa]|uniref:nucleolar complex-associated protein 2 n=1 Tax=Rosa rugosa TaxID=74645 RepID=UPI002B412A24|nr:nucleolar complex-associated protein 2 [Rosa rugosa]